MDAREDTFRDHPDFHRRATRAAILAATLDSADFQSGRTKPPAGLPAYLASLYRFPVLARSGEQKLFLKLNCLKFLASRLRQRAPRRRAELLAAAYAVRNQVVECNLRLVVHFAKRALRVRSARAQTFDELVSLGNFSLLKAVDGFDVARLNRFGTTTRFSTYASWAITKNFWRRPKSDRQLAREFEAEEDMGGFVDQRQAEPCEIGLRRDLFARARTLMDRRLTKRERKILLLRNGLDGPPRTLDQVGDLLRLSKERVRQQQTTALQKLRAHLP